ncbi:MAG: hypothetical protein KDD56_01680 [Bdellovibrionales bacterium]|nr:hypothetical protein [Bdellovibrionales bacterium]
MQISDLNELAESDSTWEAAKQIANTRLRMSSQTWQLIKSSWYGQTELMDFYKTISFSHLDPRCLLHAAEMSDQEFKRDILTLEKAIAFLGTRYCSVVLAINVACKMILKTCPENYWETLLRKLITSVEIGSKLGSKCKELGMEGGAIVGFSRYLGMALFLAQDQKKYRQLVASQNSESAEPIQVQLYGCSDYQVAAFGLLRLGFGPEISLGASLGIGNLNPKHGKYPREVLRWRAAIKWIEALEAGLEKPKDSVTSRFFPEIAPAQGSESNISLDDLLAEVKKINDGGSKWTWHLPQPGYEETQSLISSSLPRK